MIYLKWEFGCFFLLRSSLYLVQGKALDFYIKLKISFAIFSAYLLKKKTLMKELWQIFRNHKYNISPAKHAD